MEQELNIVRLKVPDLNVKLAQQAVQIVQRLRTMDLKKSPSVSETLDWAKALVALNADHKEVFINEDNYYHNKTNADELYPLFKRGDS